MTFNPNADVSKNRAQHRGRNTAIAGGGVVGLGAIAVLLISAFTGVDLTSFLGGAGGSAPQGAEATATAECLTGEDANATAECRVSAAELPLNQFWEKNVSEYRSPTLVIVHEATSSPCGTASNAVGPFYCPSDEGVYVDVTFFDLLQQQFGASAGQLAQVYIVAHEFGHHIQNITGIMQDHPQNGTGPGSNGVRMELQADCYAGATIGNITEQTDDAGVPYLMAPTEAEIRDALDAASAVGDDHIQERSGVSNPESWTHGSSEQRKYWFARGFQYGLEQCDTFAVSEAELTPPAA